MARTLAAAGADVLIVSRNEDELDAALGEILDGTESEGAYVVADLSDRSEADRVAQEALKRFGGVDILVNNAGANTPQAVDEITDEAWDQVIDVHLNTALALTRAVVPGMKERGWGRIIYVTSILAHEGMAGRHAYSAAKGALTGLARSNAVELGPHGITVNCIAPGSFLTELPRRNLTEEQQQQVALRSVLERSAEPEEIAGPILLLASDAGGYVTGRNLVFVGVNTWVPWVYMVLVMRMKAEEKAKE